MSHQINFATASPCNGFCEIDPKTDLCKGCFRTMSEIISWQSYDYSQKKEVLQKVMDRKKKLKQSK